MLSCSLALAILGSACRLPELAGSDEMAERVPALVKARNRRTFRRADSPGLLTWLFLQVIKAGGVPGLIARPAPLPGAQEEQVCRGISCLTPHCLSQGRT